MSAIIYEDRNEEPVVEQILLNGQDGAISVYVNEEAKEWNDDVLTFENVYVARRWISKLSEAIDKEFGT